MPIFDQETRAVLETATGALQESDVAQTILQQLGGSGRLKAMIGAKHFMSIDKGMGLSFQFPNQNRSQPNAVNIRYNAGTDEYNVEFGRASNSGYKVLKKVDGVQASELKRLFTQTTGLHLSL